VGEVFQRFLRSSTLQEWSECLQHYGELQQSHDQALTQGLCISYYVQWLSQLSGDAASESEASAAALAFTGAIAGGTFALQASGPSWGALSTSVGEATRVLPARCSVHPPDSAPRCCC
jgi:hypothetical protein